MSNFNFQKKHSTQQTKKKVVQRSLPKQKSPHMLAQRAQVNPSSLTHDEVLQLQREIGNKATMKLLNINEGRSAPPDAIQLRRKGGHIKKQMFRDMGRGIANSWDVVSGQRRRRANADRAPDSPRLTINQSGVPAEYWQNRLREKQQVQSFYVNYGNQAERFGNLDAAYDIPIERIINSPLAYAMFKDHCDAEFAGENYLFVDLLRAPSKTRFQHMVDAARGIDNSSPIKRVTKIDAIHIYKTTVAAGTSDNEINISSGTRKAIELAVSSLEGASGFGRNASSESSLAGLTGYVQPELQELYQKAYYEVMKNVADSYQRFASTDRYNYAAVALDTATGTHLRTMGTKTKRWFGSLRRGSGEE